MPQTEGPVQITLPVGNGEVVNFNLDQVALVEGAGGKVRWITALGSFIEHGAYYAARSVKRLGEGSGLVRVGQGRFLNLSWLRSILWVRKEKRFHFGLAAPPGVKLGGSGEESGGTGVPGGPELPPGEILVRHPMMKPIAQALGMPHLYHVEPLPPLHQILWQEGLRDYSKEIYQMSREELVRYFTRPGEVGAPTSASGDAGTGGAGDAGAAWDAGAIGDAGGAGDAGAAGAGDAAEKSAAPHIEVERLMANLIWQLHRYRTLGISPSYGVWSLRGFWYRPVFVVLNRLGLAFPEGPGEGVAALEAAAGLDAAGLEAASAAELPEPFARLLREAAGSEGLEDNAPREGLEANAAGRGTRSNEYYYRQTLAKLVQMSSDYRLFTYRELGFADLRPDLRFLGERRPGVVIVCEKVNLFPAALLACQRWGISGVCLGGNPTWLPTECFAEKLLEVFDPAQPLHLVTLVDYDPFGWLLAEMFRDQLSRYGLTTAELRHLVLPSRFTPKELRDTSYRLTSKYPPIQTKIRKWFRLTGGINGKRRGIHSDQLWPEDRILKAVEESCGDIL